MSLPRSLSRPRFHALPLPPRTAGCSRPPVRGPRPLSLRSHPPVGRGHPKQHSFPASRTPAIASSNQIRFSAHPEHPPAPARPPEPIRARPSSSVRSQSRHPRWDRLGLAPALTCLRARAGHDQCTLPVSPGARSTLAREASRPAPSRAQGTPRTPRRHPVLRERACARARCVRTVRPILDCK